MQLHLGLIPPDVLADCRRRLKDQSQHFWQFNRCYISGAAADSVFNTLDTYLRPLMPEGTALSSRNALNAYIGPATLQWHNDASTVKNRKVLSVTAIRGEGVLCFKRGGSGGMFNPQEAEFSFLLRPGDVVMWTQAEETAGLLHGGQFDAGRVTAAMRYS